MNVELETVEIQTSFDDVRPLDVHAHISVVDELKDFTQAQLNFIERLQKRRNWISRGRTSRKR